MRAQCVNAVLNSAAQLQKPAAPQQPVAPAVQAAPVAAEQPTPAQQPQPQPAAAAPAVQTPQPAAETPETPTPAPVSHWVSCRAKYLEKSCYKLVYSCYCHLDPQEETSEIFVEINFLSS